MVDFDVRRLALLRALYRLGTVTAVARSQHLTPTAVSQQLKVLEREAGTALLRRVGRRVELTDAGRTLALASADVEVALAAVSSRWGAYRGEVGGTVGLSVFPTAGQRLLPGLLHRLSAHPDLVLDVSEADLPSDRYPARCDEVDVVLAHRAGDEADWQELLQAEGRATTVVELAREPLDVAVAPGHPVAALASVGVADVVGEAWVSVPEGWPFDRILQAWFAAAGHRARVRYRFTDLRLQEALVAAGHGVALLPREAVDDRGGRRLVLRPTASGTQGRILVALSRTDRAQRVAVRTVLAALVAEARSTARP